MTLLVFVGAIMAACTFAVYAALPVLIGTMTGAVLGDLLSGVRSRPMAVGGMCGGVAALTLFVKMCSRLA